MLFTRETLRLQPESPATKSNTITLHRDERRTAGVGARHVTSQSELAASSSVKSAFVANRLRPGPPAKTGALDVSINSTIFSGRGSHSSTSRLRVNQHDRPAADPQAVPRGCGTPHHFKHQRPTSRRRFFRYFQASPISFNAQSPCVQKGHGAGAIAPMFATAASIVGVFGFSSGVVKSPPVHLASGADADHAALDRCDENLTVAHLAGMWRRSRSPPSPAPREIVAHGDFDQKIPAQSRRVFLFSMSARVSQLLALKRTAVTVMPDADLGQRRARCHGRKSDDAAVTTSFIRAHKTGPSVRVRFQILRICRR